MLAILSAVSTRDKKSILNLILNHLRETDPDKTFDVELGRRAWFRRKHSCMYFLRKVWVKDIFSKCKWPSFVYYVCPHCFEIDDYRVTYRYLWFIRNKDPRSD